MKQSKYKKLDDLFSKFIRQRDSFDGYNRCFTCGKILPLTKLQCGHFMSRRFLATRWDEKNCQPQCVSCNIFHEGMHYEFGLKLDEKYGQGTSQILKVRSQNRFNGYIKELEKHYEQKLKEK